MSQILTKNLFAEKNGEKGEYVLKLKLGDVVGDSIKIRWSFKTLDETTLYSGRLYSSIGENMFDVAIKEILTNVNTLSAETVNFTKWDGDISNLT